jgi:membrane fusion protein, heavy metal efflux system
MKSRWKLLVAVILIGGGVTGLTLNHRTRAHVIEVWKQLSNVGGHEEEIPNKDWLGDLKKERTRWDRTLSVSEAQIMAIGLKTGVVEPQSKPIVLKLTGTTDYDPATVRVVRTMFDSRVDKVLVDLGATVKIGDPLLELFSNDLADAKSKYEMAVSQWTRDKAMLDYKGPLAKAGTLKANTLLEVQNDEAQSRLTMKLAMDKLLVYGLTAKEIENAKSEDGERKAQMTLRSRAAGIVVKRDVVQGNIYTASDSLLTIAPLDHLWVKGGVSELDAEKIEDGEKLRIEFPFSDTTIDAKVDYIEKAIDPDTRSARFRASIRNPNGKFKAGQFVRVYAEIPPAPGQTVVPRSAMISVDRSDYVFVRKPGKANVFERRLIFVTNERNDFVVVADPSQNQRGLKPGEVVVVTGGLILQQMYEDRTMAEGGLLTERPLEASVDPHGVNRVIISKTH